MAAGFHLIPSRTQKLSPPTAKIVPRKLGAKLARCPFFIGNGHSGNGVAVFFRATTCRSVNENLLIISPKSPKYGAVGSVSVTQYIKESPGMGRGRKRKTQKMKNRKRQTQKKAMLKKRRESVRKSRAS